MKIKKVFLTISLAIFMVFSLSLITPNSLAYWSKITGDSSQVSAISEVGDWDQVFPWDANTNYIKKDIIIYNGVKYIAKKNNTNIEPEVTYKWFRYWREIN